MGLHKLIPESSDFLAHQRHLVEVSDALCGVSHASHAEPVMLHAEPVMLFSELFHGSCLGAWWQLIALDVVNLGCFRLLRVAAALFLSILQPSFLKLVDRLGLCLDLVSPPLQVQGFLPDGHSLACYEFCESRRPSGTPQHELSSPCPPTECAWPKQGTCIPSAPSQCAQIPGFKNICFSLSWYAQVLYLIFFPCRSSLQTCLHFPCIPSAPKFFTAWRVLKRSKRWNFAGDAAVNLGLIDLCRLRGHASASVSFGLLALAVNP